MDQIDRSIRQSGRRGGGGSNAALTTLAKESFDILTLLPNYIESTKTAVSELKQDTQVRKFASLLSVEQFDHKRIGPFSCCFLFVCLKVIIFRFII